MTDPARETKIITTSERTIVVSLGMNGIAVVDDGAGKVLGAIRPQQARELAIDVLFADDVEAIAPKVARRLASYIVAHTLEFAAAPSAGTLSAGGDNPGAAHASAPGTNSSERCG